MLLVEDKLRLVATELLQSETNAELKKMLTEMTFDASIEGTKARRTPSSPALPVPGFGTKLPMRKEKRLGLEMLLQNHILLDAPRDGDVQDA